MDARFIINEYRTFAEWLAVSRRLEPRDAKREAFGAELLAARLVRVVTCKPFQIDQAEGLCRELKDITKAFCDKVDAGGFCEHGVGEGDWCESCRPR